MDGADQEVLAVRLEGFLAKAIKAEARGDLAEAERAFRLALFCEAKMRLDVTDAIGYVRSAGPLFPSVAQPAGGSGAPALA